MTQKEKKQIRETIIEFLGDKNYTPVNIDDLYAEIIKNTPVVEDDFMEVMDELYEEFVVSLTKRKKILLSTNAGYMYGRFSASGKGFGFVIPNEKSASSDSGSGDYFVPPDYTSGAMTGDEVLFRPINKGETGYGKGSEARIYHITKRAHDTVIGTIHIPPAGIVLPAGISKLENGMKAYVSPDSDRLKFSVLIGSKGLGKAMDGQKVEVKITGYPEENGDVVTGKVIKVLGDPLSREANYEAVLIDNDIKTVFLNRVVEEAELEASQEIVSDGRLDLRDKIIFTIDGSDAKDLDDAISLEVTDSGYILGVHIADVSHYVKARSKIDEEAFERGTSVYFTDKVVPMLPVALSNGSCSLNGGVDRYALSAIITLDKNGAIIETEMANSIINSKIRGVYSEINDIFEHGENGENSEFYKKYEHVCQTLSDMKKLYEILADRSDKRGALEFETEEAKILLDETGFPYEIIKRERGISERLVEQFMLCANMAVASWLHWQNIPCVYRIHEDPDPEKIRAFSTFAHNLGLNTSILSKKKILPSHLKVILDQADKRGISEIVSGIMLRSLMKAKYSDEAKGHFGLAADLYCHFTSPIRRYPDLSVHRIVKTVLSGSITQKKMTSLAAFAQKSAVVSTENEMKATLAERQITDLYTALYMTKHIGEEFDAVICSVANFGLFARTENLCEGLIPASTLGGITVYDEKNFTLKCGNKMYRLGNKIRVKIEDADVVHRRITMSAAE